MGNNLLYLGIVLESRDNTGEIERAQISYAWGWSRSVLTQRVTEFEIYIIYIFLKTLLIVGLRWIIRDRLKGDLLRSYHIHPGERSWEGDIGESDLRLTIV